MRRSAATTIKVTPPDSSGKQRLLLRLIERFGFLSVLAPSLLTYTFFAAIRASDGTLASPHPWLLVTFLAIASALGLLLLLFTIVTADVDPHDDCALISAKAEKTLETEHRSNRKTTLQGRRPSTADRGQASGKRPTDSSIDSAAYARVELDATEVQQVAHPHRRRTRQASRQIYANLEKKSVRVWRVVCRGTVSTEAEGTVTGNAPDAPEFEAPNRKIARKPSQSPRDIPAPTALAFAHPLLAPHGHIRRHPAVSRNLLKLTRERFEQNH